MNQTLKGIIKLTRFNEYIWFVIVTTALGAAAAGGTFGWQWIVALLANWTAVGFAFMNTPLGCIIVFSTQSVTVRNRRLSPMPLVPRERYTGWQTAIISNIIPVMHYIYYC